VNSADLKAEKQTQARPFNALAKMRTT